MLNVGYLLPTREALLAGSGFDELLSLAELAESSGFDSVWIGDSILARPRFEVLTSLAAVAARTRRVTLGTAVMLPMLRQPVVLANEIANVDRIAGGRLVLGVGIGSKTDAVAREFAACGVPAGERVGRFEETIELMRRLWREPSVSHKGRYFELADVRPVLRPASTAGPPFWLAGSVETALRRVVRIADGWMPNSPTPAIFAQGRADLMRIARDVNRDPSTIHCAAYTTINVNADAARAQAELRAFIEAYYDSPLEVQVKRQGVCAGTPDTCLEWLNGFTAGGAQTLIIRFGGPDQRDQMRTFMRDVRGRLP